MQAEHPTHSPSLGATYLGGGRCQFVVWAPFATKVDLKLIGEGGRDFPMQKLDRGYFALTVDDVPPGTRYLYRVDGKRERPDPASRFQPEGVHVASAVVDSSFAWTDELWSGLPFHAFVAYEIHVGTYTPGGRFEDVIRHLDELWDLGVTAVELMPVAQFPGDRNWGYDGVHPFAVQNSYGGPTGLKALVNAAHGRGMAVILDVVYNHLGPEGMRVRIVGA